MSISADRLAQLVLAAAAIMLAGCDRPQQAPPRQEQPKPTQQLPVIAGPVSEEAPSEKVQRSEGSEGAAETLELYYALISARRYEDARRLRESGKRGPSAAEFAANFDVYADHHATVGPPSRLAEAEDWLYVEVPVQTYGTYKSGAPFGSAGTVTLRRRKQGGEWRIHTSG